MYIVTRFVCYLTIILQVTPTIQQVSLGGFTVFVLHITKTVMQPVQMPNVPQTQEQNCDIHHSFSCLYIVAAFVFFLGNVSMEEHHCHLTKESVRTMGYLLSFHFFIT